MFDGLGELTEFDDVTRPTPPFCALSTHSISSNFDYGPAAGAPQDGAETKGAPKVSSNDPADQGRAPVHNRFVGFDGYRVHLLESGAGPTVVHLHGTSTDSQSHRPLLEQLPGVHSLAVDRPGSGRTTGPQLTKRNYRKQVVDFLDGLLDALALDSATLAGARWRRLVAVVRTRTPEAGGRPRPARGRTHPAGDAAAPTPLRLIALPLLGEAIDRIIPANRAAMIRFMTVMEEGDTIIRHPALLDSLVAARANRGQPSPLPALSSAPSSHPTETRRPDTVTAASELARIPASTLLVWGEHDPLGGPRDVAKAITQALPRNISNCSLPVTSPGSRIRTAWDNSSPATSQLPPSAT